MLPTHKEGTNRICLQITRSPGCEDLPLPAYQTEEAAGMDLYAAVEEPVVIRPGQIRLISTGVRVAIPPGYEGQVRARSGLALKHGIGLVNAPGTIDSDYRGDVGAIVINFGDRPFTVERGDRIAQLVINQIIQADLKEVEFLKTSGRNAGGFGSTGHRCEERDS
jgi:dUTP pyrophosphatase